MFLHLVKWFESFWKRVFLSQEEEEEDDGETETEYETTTNLLNGGHSITSGLEGGAGAANDSSTAAAAGSPFLPSWGRQATPLPPEPPPPSEQHQHLQQQQQQHQPQQQQQFFSGDSQDSGKGYTSISVRYRWIYV